MCITKECETIVWKIPNATKNGNICCAFSIKLPEMLLNLILTNLSLSLWSLLPLLLLHCIDWNMTTMLSLLHSYVVEIANFHSLFYKLFIFIEYCFLGASWGSSVLLELHVDGMQVYQQWNLLRLYGTCISSKYSISSGRVYFQ